MIVLSDNDIVLKLAQCDLFDEFIVAFSIAPDKVNILKRTRYSLSTPRRRKQIGEESYTRLLAFLATIADLEVEPDPVFILALTEQPRIDAGEAVLFAVCPSISDSVLATGDKRSLTGLQEASVSNAVFATLCQSLAGRIICFEQILLRILDNQGFEAVRDKLIAGRESDKTLALLIGSGLDATEAAVREGLDSYIGDLRKNTGSLLLA